MAFAPWLRPGQSLSELRRTVARLRSGAISLADPRISPLVLADVIEKSIVKELLVRWIVTELGGNTERFRAIKEREERERVQHRVAAFHRLKKSPEASDPDSGVAQRVRRLDRKRRNELGRSRRRKR